MKPDPMGRRMTVIVREEGWSVEVYTREHPPAQVHAKKGGCEVKDQDLKGRSPAPGKHANDTEATEVFGPGLVRVLSVEFLLRVIRRSRALLPGPAGFLFL